MFFAIVTLLGTGRLDTEVVLSGRSGAGPTWGPATGGPRRRCEVVRSGPPAGGTP